MFIFKSLSTQLKKLKINDLSQKTLEIEFIKEWLINNIQDRLYDDGTDKDGEQLHTDGSYTGLDGFYAKSTEIIKKDKGQKTKPVTLNDTGKFYDSFKVAANKTFISLKANFKKGSEHISDNFKRSFSSEKDFESQILGLTDEDLTLFISKVFYPEFMVFLKRGVSDAVKVAKA